eukprot:2362142-Amphidinium_carterae.1
MLSTPSHVLQYSRFNEWPKLRIQTNVKKQNTATNQREGLLKGNSNRKGGRMHSKPYACSVAAKDQRHCTNKAVDKVRLATCHSQPKSPPIWAF